MGAAEILQKIAELSPAEKLFVIEKTFKDLLQLNVSQQMTIAAESMEHEYRTNSELTAFTNIDFEDFYEAK
jgi:hypothetical protein